MRPRRREALTSPSVRMFLSRTASIGIAVLATMLPGASAWAQAPVALANPCGPTPATALLSSSTARTGLIDLYYFAPLGRPVTYYECLGERAKRLGELPSAPGSDRTTFLGATSWDCGRQTRHFAATTTLPDGQVVLGTAGVRTVSCADRFALDTPRRVSPGRLAHVRVTDRWSIGDIRTRLCVTSPDSQRECRRVPFAKAVGTATRRFRLAARGRWRVELQVGDHRVRDSIAVGVRSGAPRAAPPTVLATGDSTMQGVESFLADELGNESTVVSDVRPGLSLSGDPWTVIAKAQVARLRPRTTVISIGANEGFSMRGADGVMHACCDEAWVAQYARRMRETMRIYRQHGRGRVFVLTIAAPRDPRRAAVTTAVNAAIVLAAEGLGRVRVLRMDLLFSPSGFQQWIRYGGQDVDVREADGTHLNVSGTAIEARIVVQALREVVGAQA